MHTCLCVCVFRENVHKQCQHCSSSVRRKREPFRGCCSINALARQFSHLSKHNHQPIQYNSSCRPASAAKPATRICSYIQLRMVQAKPSGQHWPYQFVFISRYSKIISTAAPTNKQPECCKRCALWSELSLGPAIMSTTDMRVHVLERFMHLSMSIPRNALQHLDMPQQRRPHSTSSQP